jgi:hypothetical protein
LDSDWSVVGSICRPLFDISRQADPVLAQELWQHIFSYIEYFHFITLFEFSVVCKQWWLIIHSEHFLARVREQLAYSGYVCLLDKASTKWILSPQQVRMHARSAHVHKFKVSSIFFSFSSLVHLF